MVTYSRVCPSLTTSNLMDFQKNLYESHAARSHSTIVHSNFLTWRPCENVLIPRPRSLPLVQRITVTKLSVGQKEQDNLSPGVKEAEVSSWSLTLIWHRGYTDARDVFKAS
jgi:hypothetical protein